MKQPINFALIGASGYIAPRHMKAIRETGNRITALLDPYDGIGIIDSYFPEADFFSESERFDRHLDKMRRAGDSKIEYVSICSPNYLHDAHIRMAMRNQAHVICEKPLVLNPWNIDALAEIESETGKKINNILQLRIHDSIRQLKADVEAQKDRFFDVDLTYITSRGKWYHRSWKGDESKSGGIATNIGIHFFDMLTWIFGDVEQSLVHLHTDDKASGFFRLKNANVRWFLSIDENDLPDEIKGQKRTFRSIKVNGEEFEFSEGFTELHTESYKHILAGNGFGLEDARRSIDIVYNIRNSAITPLTGDFHPILKKIKL
ncbi:MAG: oxidoreductase [Bacteroidetes bacterium HGW-Bacteroidetes-6]|jgi:UDP-N-acetyl-2-amino-2-deoxyglucuronate dehydrogenase|nr:MAG: oxidoreductase [Bacteroidetes bacterium HGW-Bacteroidetes-6]